MHRTIQNFAQYSYFWMVMECTTRDFMKKAFKIVVLPLIKCNLAL
jgi:hypothetical protein